MADNKSLMQGLLMMIQIFLIGPIGFLLHFFDSECRKEMRSGFWCFLHFIKNALIIPSIAWLGFGGFYLVSQYLDCLQKKISGIQILSRVIISIASPFFFMIQRITLRNMYASDTELFTEDQMRKKEKQIEKVKNQFKFDTTTFSIKTIRVDEVNNCSSMMPWFKSDKKAWFFCVFGAVISQGIFLWGFWKAEDKGLHWYGDGMGKLESLALLVGMLLEIWLLALIYQCFYLSIAQHTQFARYLNELTMIQDFDYNGDRKQVRNMKHLKLKSGVDMISEVNLKNLNTLRKISFGTTQDVTKSVQALLLICTCIFVIAAVTVFTIHHNPERLAKFTSIHKTTLRIWFYIFCATLIAFEILI